MTKYRIRPEYLDAWGATEETSLVTMSDIQLLAVGWGLSVADLLYQVTEEPED